MAVYLAHQIKAGKLDYEVITTSKRYGKYKEKIDEILKMENTWKTESDTK